MLDIKKRDIRKKADQIRRNMRISNYGIMNLYKECESVGWKVIRYPLGENADLGFAMKKDKDIIIFTNSSSRLSREIFTLDAVGGEDFQILLQGAEVAVGDEPAGGVLDVDVIDCDAVDAHGREHTGVSRQTRYID